MCEHVCPLETTKLLPLLMAKINITVDMAMGNPERDRVNPFQIRNSESSACFEAILLLRLVQVTVVLVSPPRIFTR